MSTGFRELIQSGKPILFDGAMGTQLYDKGIFINQCFDYVNLSQPELVTNVHQAYAEAGAMILKTNTFGANRFRLRAHGLEDQIEAINRQGVRLAREAGGKDVLVAGAMGPLGLKIEPFGPTSIEEAEASFAEQAAILADADADLFILETFSRLETLAAAIRGIRSVSKGPIVAMLTINERGNTLYGTDPLKLLPKLDKLPVDALGFNCSVGPRTIYDVLTRMASFTSKPLCALPNAGNPKSVDGRNIYLCTPEYMANYVKRFIRSGIRILGGCCGTSPAHIKAMARVIQQAFPTAPKPPNPKPSHQGLAQEPLVKPVPFAEKSRFAAKIAAGEFVFTVEIVPPKGCDPTRTLKKISRLKEAGIDAVNIPDGPRASSRMSPLVLATLIESQIGMETILHYCCRDRNILGIQSDLLGGYAAGLKNILAVTGDPPKLGDYPDATAVFDVDSIGLANIITGLNHGLDIGGNPLKKPTAYAMAVALNPSAVNPEEEWRRFRWKADAGAEFAITQPVFDVDQFLHCHEVLKDCQIPVVAGIWPLFSYKNAEFMNNEVPGVSIPQSVMEGMRACQTKEEARAFGLKTALANVARILPYIAGIQISAPLGNVRFAIEVAEGVRALLADRPAVKAAAI